MDLIWVMFTFFIVVTMIFVIIGLFFPEWIGITGKKAHEIQRHQQQEVEANNEDSTKKDE